MSVKRKDVQDIVQAIGGKENVDTATHCVTRLRLVLKDDNKVDKEALSNNTLVKGQFKADNQYQIVIGPGTVDEVYKQFVNETGVETASKDEAKTAAAKKGNPLQRLVKLLGDIFIPILPALVTAGLLMGINNLLTMEHLFGPKALVEQHHQLGDISNIINVIASTAFIFLPALIGWSSMKVFGGSPILGLVLGLILMHPQLVSQYDIAKGQIPTWNLFGLEIKQLNYQGQVLPVLIAAYVLSLIEKALNKVVHDSIKMLVVGPVALLITGFLSFIIIGPIALGIGTYLWPIVAISNICQGSAAFGAWLIYKRRKMAKEEGLALTSGVSAFLGVTEPAMFGVNLPLKVPFFAAICTSGILGAVIGANRVLGNVGVGGVPAFISIQSKYWYIYIPVILLAMILPAVLTVVFSKFTKVKAKEMIENPDDRK